MIIDLTPEQQERLQNAVVAFSNNNPAFIEQLEKLVEIKENKPGLWESGKKFLKL